MRFMFAYTDAFNQNIGDWDVSNVTDMQGMFFEASNFNQDIGDWDLSSVTQLEDMFANTTAFNQDISDWDVSSVEVMSSMFRNASSFNQNLENWDVSNVTNMAFMFDQASSFNQDLGDWDITSITLDDAFGGIYMLGMLDNSGLSTENYDATLTGWESQAVQNDMRLGAAGLTYCNGKDARQALIDDHSWTITGDSENCRFAPFITTWRTDNPGVSNELSIRIPMIGNGYDFNVDWGDGSDEDYNTNPGDDVEHFLEHTYASAGVYEVKITGDFPRIYINSEGDEDKILTIEQWGDIAWTSMNDAFRGANNLTYNATDAPDLSAVTDMSGAFKGTDMFNGDIGNWDVSTI